MNPGQPHGSGPEPVCAVNRGQASDRLIRAALPMGQKLVLMVYMMHQSSKDKPETAVSWPALATLVRYVQASRSFVMEARNALIEAGILIVVERPEYGNLRCRIDFDRIAEAPEEESADCKRRNRGKRDRTASPPGTATAPHRDRNSSPPGTAVVPLEGPPQLPIGTATAPRSLRREPSVVDPSAGTLPQPSVTRRTGSPQPSPTVEPSPPPAEPSGSPSDRWMAAAEELDPDGWRDEVSTVATKEFQPSSNAYVFEDAHHDSIPEVFETIEQIKSPATRAPEVTPNGPRPSPTHPQGNGEGAPGLRAAPPRPAAAQPSLWPAEAPPAPKQGDGSPPAPDASGGPVAGAPAAKAKRTPKEAPPPREPAPSVELDHPDDPCPLLLGGKVSIDHLTADIVEVYRSWWRRQLSPATCRLTAGRLGLIRQALGTYKAAQLVHLVRYAYEAADLGKFGRAWRGDNGQTPPDLEMLLRGEHVARNVEMAGRWSVERVSGAPPAEPLPASPPPMPSPPSPFPFRGGGRDFASMTATLARIARDDLNERGAHHGQ